MDDVSSPQHVDAVTRAVPPVIGEIHSEQSNEPSAYGRPFEEGAVLVDPGVDEEKPALGEHSDDLGSYTTRQIGNGIVDSEQIPAFL